MSFTKAIKTTIAVTVLSAAGLSATLTPASAAGYMMDAYGYVISVESWDQLNMRKWPAAHSQKVGAIPHYGSGFYIQRCIAKPGTSDWCKVYYQGQWGWVNKRFLATY
ncbi:MAG: hypothetical protein AAF468_13420 [Pseudomonadota bacterium]